MYKQFFVFGTGFLGGLLAFFLNLPIPWLIGSLLLFILLSRKIKFDSLNKTFAKYLRILLGVSIGGIASQSLDASSKSIITPIIFSIPIFVVFATIIGAVYFRRRLKFNALDSLITALPGGLTFIISISDGLGQHFPKIAMMHTVRMLIMISTFAVFAFFMPAGPDQAQNGLDAFNLFGLLADYSNIETLKLIALILLSIGLTKVLRFSGGDLILPLILSLLVYKAGLVSIPMPEIINIIAMVAFGTILGQKIASKLSMDYLAQAKASAIYTGFCLLAAFIFAQLISSFTGIDYFLIFLALAPGSIPEISLIAIAMGYDVGLIAVAHILRYLLVMMMGALGVYRFKNDTEGLTDETSQNKI